MMNEALINRYIGPGMCYNDFKDFGGKVTVDDYAWKVNQLCFGRWSYDVEILKDNGDGTIVIKASFYCPMKHVCGFAETTYKDIQRGIDEALVDAINRGFNFKERHSNESNRPTTAEVTKEMKEKKEENKNKEEDKKDNNVLTTLEELDKIEKEIGMTRPEKAQDENVQPVQQNKFGIRQDQIDFMKKFQETFKIDNEVKFDSYVSAWNDMKHTNILTKKQLISAGEKAVDDFISWIKEVNNDNVANNNFVCPTDEEFNEICSN